MGKQIRVWSDKEIKLLKSIYKNKSNRELSEIFNTTIPVVKNTKKKFGLKLTEPCKDWTDFEINYLKENYRTMPIKNIMKTIKRSKGSIATRASKMGLIGYETWITEELDFIRDNWEIKTDKEMADILKRTEQSTAKQRKRMKLKRERPINYNPSNKLDFNTIKNFIEIESDSGCVLLSEEYFNDRTKLKIKCECGNEFEASFNKFKHRNKYTCNDCSDNKNSKGSMKIEKYLDLNNIECIKEFKFDDCRNDVTSSLLSFDFSVFNNGKLHCLIEYDGRQHFKPVEIFEGEEGFKRTKYRDNLKNKYCKMNNIKLIRIPYWDFDNIEKILDRELSSLINPERVS